MRILFLHPYGWRGEYPMLLEFLRHGHEVCVLEERRTGMTGKRMLKDYLREPGDGIRTLWYHPGKGMERALTLPLDRWFRKTFDGRNLGHRMWVIREAVRHFAPDLVYCTDGFSYAVPAALLKRWGLLRQPLIASYIGGDILDCSHMGYGRKRTPQLDWLMRTSIRHIDALRALCDSLARALLKDGADPARITQIPIQIGSPRELYEEVYAQRAQARAEVRERLGIPQDAPTVMTLSDNYFSKGVQDFARAWPGVLSSHPDAWWILAGPEAPWLSEGILPLLDASVGRARVRLTGRLAGRELFAQLAAADLNVNPTLCEGLNMVTVDAATVGTPTVCSDAAGISDWVRRHDCGLVYAAGDVRALERAVIEALAQGERLSGWSLRCRGMIADFSAESVFRRLADLFARTLHSARLPEGKAGNGK
ncbi:MAG: glycosyltransferase family 4 protein [Burkholderiales bacterium]|nr:glycosyltransferase family 4 protein [Burkholderiales bacterium]